MLYAPNDAPLDRLVTLYQQAKRYIYVSVYGLTYPRAVQALVAAKKRGVDVRMLTDQERTQEVKQRTALQTLRLAGIPIRVNQHEGLMHLKQVVIDDEINTSGSMNHTTSGNSYNDERMDIITDRGISLKAREQFLSLWNDRARFREIREALDAAAGSQMRTEETDVAIVGAGGGGAVLALALGQQGIRTVVLDQAPGPPKGLRGELLQPNGQEVLDRLGVLGALPSDATRAIRASFISAGPAGATVFDRLWRSAASVQSGDRDHAERGAPCHR